MTNKETSIDVGVKNHTGQAECSIPKKVIVLGSPPCFGGNSGLIGVKGGEGFNKDNCKHGQANEPHHSHFTALQFLAKMFYLRGSCN